MSTCLLLYIIYTSIFAVHFYSAFFALDEIILITGNAREYKFGVLSIFSGQGQAKAISDCEKRTTKTAP
jgi:hypothetical protein